MTKILALLFSFIVYHYGHSQIIPIGNNITGQRITKVVEYNNELYLAADSSLYKYSGSSFQLLRTFSGRIIDLDIGLNKVFIMYSSEWDVKFDCWNGSNFVCDSSIVTRNATTLLIKDSIFHLGIIDAPPNPSTPYSGLLSKYDPISKRYLGGTSIYVPYGIPYGCGTFVNDLTVHQDTIYIAGHFESPYQSPGNHTKSGFINEFGKFIGERGINAFESEVYKGELYICGDSLHNYLGSYGGLATWDGSSFSQIRDPKLEAFHTILNISATNEYLFAFPNIKDSTFTKTKVIYYSGNSWLQLSDTLKSNLAYFNLDVIKYQNEYYLYGDEMILNDTLVFPKFGKIGSTVALREIKNAHSSVYPNPNSGVFKLELPEGWQLVASKLINLSGRIVRDNISGSLIDVSDLRTGTYILITETNQGLIKNRIIKK